MLAPGGSEINFRRPQKNKNKNPQITRIPHLVGKGSDGDGVVQQPGEEDPRALGPGARGQEAEAEDHLLGSC